MVQFMCKVVMILQARVKRDVGDEDGSALDSVFEFIFHCVAALSTFALLAKFNVSLVYADQSILFFFEFSLTQRRKKEKRKKDLIK